jgi:aminomethyltransferase
VHEALGAVMTPFAGWLMPLRYASETAEHVAVRKHAGLFDLSHMGEIRLTGPGAGDALDYALTGNLSALAPGRARYTMMCAPDGGVVDDLVVYRTGGEQFLVIANAANAPTVYAELSERSARYDVTVANETEDYALIAVQGPAAAAMLGPLTDVDLAGMKYYAGAAGSVAGRAGWVARTGYTGEDGFEVYCAPGDAVAVWEALAGAGAMPAGLSARDTLRLEAGMPLYGNELGLDRTPFEANLGRVVKFEKAGDFVGRAALVARSQAGAAQVLTGLTLAGRRAARHGYPVLAGGKPCGIVTSGAPSPTLGVPIAMAYVDAGAGPDLAVDIRGTQVPANVVDLPFYRRSK